MAIQWIKDHPWESLLIGAGAAAVAGTAYVLLSDSEERSVFKKAPSVSFLESTGDHVDILISAVKEAGAEGVFDAETVGTMERRFRAHATEVKPGEWILDAAGFIKVCQEIGIRDAGVVEALFKQWDADGSGTIEFSEFLHVLAFSRRASTQEKLEAAFSLMDPNGDGQVTYAEMARFFGTVYRAIGKPKTPSQVAALVNQVFAKLDKDNSACIDKHEFTVAARSVRLSTGDTLATLMDSMMDRFGTISSQRARRLRSGEETTGRRGAALAASLSAAPGASSSSSSGQRTSVFLASAGPTKTSDATSKQGPPLTRQPTRD